MAGFPARIRLALIPLIVGRLKMLSGRMVGVAGMKGAYFRVVDRAMDDGAEADFRRWLSHRNPKVRALGLTCLCLYRPDDLETAIAPLMDDPATVIGSAPVGNVWSNKVDAWRSSPRNGSLPTRPTSATVPNCDNHENELPLRSHLRHRDGHVPARRRSRRRSRPTIFAALIISRTAASRSFRRTVSIAAAQRKRPRACTSHRA